MSENNAEMMQPAPEFFERMKLYTDTLECKRVDRICAAPMIMYLPIYLYGGATVHDIMMDYSKANDCYIRALPSKVSTASTSAGRASRSRT